MEPQSTFTFRVGTELRYGAGVTGQLDAVVRDLAPSAERAGLVIDHALRDQEAFAGLERTLRDGGLAVATVTVEREPYEGDVDRMAEELSARNVEVVVGVGGGSTLDSAKAINMRIRNPGPLGAYREAGSVPAPGLPLISVPTTAGTGSEVDGGVVLVDADTGEKWGLVDLRYVPAVALLDPSLAVGLPPAPTAWCAADAIAQTLGAAIVTISQPLVPPLAAHAIRLLLDGLPRAMADGSDLAARGSLQLGSALGGIAMANAECAVDHAFGEVVGGRYGIPHGVSVATFLLATTRLTMETAADRYARVARLVRDDWADLDDREACAQLLPELEAAIGHVPLKPLREYGVTEDDLPELVALTEAHFCMDINPRRFSPEETLEIYRQAM